MVALVDSPVRLLLKVLKKVLTGHGLTCEVLSHFPEGSVITGVLVPEPSPNPPEKGTGDFRGLLLDGISSSLKGPFLPAPVGAFLAFAKKKKETNS